MTTRLDDQQAREQALDAGRSFIVQAPAGSGKTELLIQRYLVLLAQVEAPEEIVAITFTRKAAAEMRGRILAALASAAGEAPPEPHRRHTWNLARTALARDQAQGWNLREHPARLRVLTIDAFNASLVRRLPWLSQLGGTPATVEDARPYFQQAARNLLARMEQGGDVGGQAMRLLRHLDNQVERTEGLLGALLARRDQWLRHLGTGGAAPLRAELESAWRNVLSGTLAALHAALAPYADEIAACAVHAARMLEASRPESPLLACRNLDTLPPPEPGQIVAWRGMAELLLTEKGEWRSPRGITRNNGFPNDTGPQKAAKSRMVALVGNLGADAGLAHIPELLQQLPNPTFTDAEWAVIAALLTLLPQAVEELREAFRSGGIADFIEMALAAYAALGAQATEDRVRHLLLDEFQDTSTSQFRLLERLIADWAPGDGRTLFLVGDPMQSIYRFREAEVGLFLRAWGGGIGALPLEALTLRSNFRSGAAVVDWVNRTFAQVFPGQADIATGAVVYSEAVAVHPAGQSGVTIHPIVVPDGDAAWGAVHEAERVADLAWRARQGAPQSSVAILVRARTHLAEILPALRAVGLPFRAVEIEGLAEQPVVRDLVALTRALLFPADRVAWLAVLRAPSVGLTLADLLALTGTAPGAAMWDRINDAAVRSGLSADGRTRLERARAVLGEVLARRDRQSLRAWVETGWISLGGPAGLRDLELAQANSFLAVLDNLALDGGEPTPEELTRHLEGLYADPDPDPSAVQVMTIHKAKGLEFDTVILPGLGRKAAVDMPLLLRWQELPEAGAGALLLTPIGETGMDQNANFRYLSWLERKKADQEMRRVAYVAATRAIHHLHLLGVALDNEGNLKAPHPQSMLALLWPSLEGDFRGAAVIPAPPVAAGDEVVSLSLLRRLPAGWSPPAPPPDARPAIPPPVEEEPRETIEYSWVGFTARRVGTVVHRLLLRMAREGADAWPPDRLAAQAPGLRTLLAQSGVPDAELDGAVDRALAALRATLADPKGRWVLQRHADDRSEYDVTALLEGEVRRLRVDRTFVDADGVRWIIDYKTSTHEGGGTDAFLDQEVGRYRDAMERYAHVLRTLDPALPVRLALYFPLIPSGWREWPAAS